jgi:hypothetical protein
MLTPKLKLKYELHYWDTDVSGTSESGFETFHLKPIYFPTQGEWGSWKYKLAVGAEWIVGFGNEDCYRHYQANGWRVENHWPRVDRGKAAFLISGKHRMR